MKRHHDSRAGRRRVNKIEGQFTAFRVEMQKSPAFRVLSLSAHRVLHRICIELSAHGGRCNGKLPVTFSDFMEYGVHHHGIAPAIRELEALGFIKITQRGRAGNAEFRRPTFYELTFVKGTSFQPEMESAAD